MRTVAYANGKVQLIDQRKLPWELEIAEYSTYQEVADAIRDMVVRGAPAIGAAAGFGLALAAADLPADNVPAMHAALKTAADHLKQARPTAVNLFWAVDRIYLAAVSPENTTSQAIAEAALHAAQTLADEDVEINKRMAEHGAALINDGDTILHHCNTGALATVDWGTALGVVRTAHEQGKRIHVLVDETRPRLQGARLTAWELKQAGISFEIIADGAAGHFMKSGEVKAVLVGSDRTAANGDVANKIGTYMLAVLAKENRVPFYPVVPTSTIDLSLAHGDLIPIEERSPSEVTTPYGLGITPADFPARNPAFDVTPNRYVTGIITEKGIAYPPFEISLSKLVEATETEKA